MTTRSNPRLIALSLALSVAALPAAAQEFGSKSALDSEKNCIVTDGKGVVTLGYQTGGGLEDSSKLQQYETVPKGAILPCVAFAWKNDKDFFIKATGTKLGLDDQFASVVLGKKNFKLFGSWDQNPNWLSNTARTPYTETSPGVFRVPDGMRKALQDIYVPWIPPTAANPIGTGTAPANPTVPGFYAVEAWVNNAFPVDLSVLRRTGKTGMSYKAGENTSFNLSYGREMRDGHKNQTFYGGPNYEIASPIQYTTDDFRAEADFAKGRVFANAAINYNKFTNDVPYNVIDNPERLELANPANGRNVINDVTTFRLWQAPDNDAYTVDLTGGITFPKRHKLTASVSTGSMKASRELTDISTNPFLATSATAPNTAFTVRSPYPSYEAQFNTFMGALKFTGDPNKHFGYILSYRKWDLTDKTQPYTFTNSVRGDVGPSVSATGFTREHEGWGSQNLKAEIHFLPAKGLRLGASYGEDKREYDIREYSDVTDKNIAFTADYNHEKFAVHGSWTALDRKPGEPNEEAIPASWQGATQTDITERTRHILSGIVTLMPSEKLAISLNGTKLTNEFAESVTGLLDQSFDLVGADVTFAPNEKVSAWAGYTYEKFFFDMAAAYIPRGLAPPFDPANLWANKTTDKIDTFRVGFRAVLVPDKWDLNGDFDYSKPRSDSIYDFTRPGTPIGGLNEANGIFPANVPALPGFPPYTFDRFPQVSKAFTIAKIRLSYQIDKSLTASVMYWKQKFDNVDWQNNNPGVNGEPLTPYMGRVDPGANRWFFLGARVPSYDANVFRASLSYRF
jgi:hypothetical protein